MKYMLDTDICIYIIKKSPSSVEKEFRRHAVDDICISAIAYGELETGVMKSENLFANRRALEEMLSGIKIVPFNALAAEVYGSIRAELDKSGKVIGSNDMLIAAHAKSLGLTLVTNNTKESDRIPGLCVENWT